ncbi:hypothetical protein P8605_10270 [Streptomyces sp. T-3]|nr:hypothetical protein [Streptomyces sp. T-3]
MISAPTASADEVIEFVYTAPEFSEEGDRVTWNWTLTNRGDQTVDKVVLVHKLTPSLPVTNASDRCTVVDQAIQCEYGSVDAGELREGKLEADVPSDLQGSPQISGQVTWQAAVATTS